jgi:homoserine kinase
MTRATVFAPASIGNVGPGFDVLGLAVDGLGDVVTVELTDGPPSVADVTGRDASLVPREPAKNVAVIAAQAYLRAAGSARNAIVTIEKGLALAGGMGGSAASSVGGALAAAFALEHVPESRAVIAAALEGEAVASGGRHLDNIAPCVLGGLVLVLSTDPVDVVAVPVAAAWWAALVTPSVRIETKAARALLPIEWDRASWIRQMANTTGITHAFSIGDGALLRRALDDLYAEPRRASLIPHFFDVKRAALDAGSIGCSISGSGPTIFAIARDEESARRCAASMQRAFAEVPSVAHVGAISARGATRR